MESNLKSEEASAIAVHKVKNAQTAIELARQVQIDEAVQNSADKMTQNMGDIVQERIEHVLARGTEQEKSIILARVPYICQDIKSMNAVLSEIRNMMAQVKVDLDAKDEKNDKKFVNQDQFAPVKLLAFGFAGAILTAFAGGLIYLVFHIK